MANKFTFEELISLVFEKNQATKANKDKLFKLAKSNNNIELIQRLIDEFNFKSAKIYFSKYSKMSIDEAVQKRDLTNLTRLIENGMSVSHINLSDLAKKKYPIEYFQILLKAGSSIHKTDDDGRTALFMAVMQNNTELVKMLLFNGANANDKAYSRESVLQIAASLGNEDIVDSLLEHKADVNITTRDKLTPLMIAVWKGHLPVVEKLLENGADLDIVDIHGVTPLIRASGEGHLEIVEFLIKQGVDINKTDNHGYSALNDANDFRHTDIQELLLEHSAEFIFDESENIKINLEPLTPLMVAIVKNDLDKIDELLDQTPDLTIKVNDETHPYYGKTALEIASIVKQRKLDELINLGRVTTYERDGRQKLKGHANDIGLISRYNEAITMIEEYFFITPLPDSNITPKENINDIVRLITATYQSDYKVVQNLLNLGVDVDSTINDNWTPLLIASNFGDYEMIKLLIENGANVNVQLQDGTSAIFLASALGNIQIVKLLIDNKIDINHKHVSGHNSLMIAIKRHHSDIANELILNGIDIDAFSWEEGENALSLAVINDNIEITKLLLESGVKVNQLTQGYFTALDLCTIENKKAFSNLLIKFGAKRCNLSIEKAKQNELILNHDLFVEDLFHKIDETITSPFIAKQFLLEELESASLVPKEDNPSAKEFVDNSGFSSIDYKGALGRSLPEVDGAIGGQQILNKWIMPYMFFKGMNDQAHGQMVVELRYKIIDLVMKKYSLGKYATKIIKLDIQNQKSTFNIFIFNAYVVDNELRRYEQITNNKYYSQEFEKYIEIDNNKVFIYTKTYEGIDNKTEYPIIEEKEIYEYEFENHISEIKIQNMKHDPKALVKILNLFTEDNPLKFTAHSFEWSRYGSYEKFMNKIEEAFTNVKNDLKILSPNLLNKIDKFLFDSSLSDDNTWGTHKIDFGWSSPELTEWCSIEDTKPNGKKAIAFNLPVQYQKEINGTTCTTFESICSVFKNEIEIRDDDKLKTLFTTLKQDILKFDFEAQYKNLEAISFYTDVENFKNGLTLIFEQFKEDGREQFDTIEIEAKSKESENYVDIRIMQIGSTVHKTSKEMEKETDNGHFQDIKNHFSSLCEWSIEASFGDGDFRIHYLSSEEKNKEPIAKPLGFTHVLRFYK